MFDPTAADIPARMRTLVERNPRRIVALRIHATQSFAKPATTRGPIRDRDLRHPNVRKTWAASAALKLAIQMHSIPAYARQFGALAAAFPEAPLIIDHLCRAGEGTPEEYKAVLALAALPGAYIAYSSREPFPHRDVKPLIRRRQLSPGGRRRVSAVQRAAAPP